jgi:Tol biopolymer transport system component/predicted Ser/Thr protein kinase
MPLSAGDRLGPYEILAPIGAGGMGEVYRARDPRLNRDVAIKVSNAEFSERFVHEARSIAALNHPHICTLYDVGPNYLVMEYIDGTPLKGPLPLDQTLKYAAQICDALDAAHKKNITHRDLKPANILVTKAGVKLLDFGLAKSSPAVKADEATVTMALTGKGQILGTLPYMSPEQINGQEADARSDIFSFGLVLYEMLTGKRAFEGSTPASVIAAVLERPAPSVADIAPPALDRVLKRCLEKDPENRWQSARDLKAGLELVGQASLQTTGLSPAGHGPVPQRWPWIVAAAAVAIATVLGAILWRSAPPTEAPLRPLVRLDIDLGAEVSLAGGGFGAILSPDGARLVYRSQDRLFIRRLDQPKATELPGTAGARAPFFSPDGQWVAFGAQEKLKKISVEGGSAVALCDAPGLDGGSWGGDGSIVAALTGNGGLSRIPAGGGAPTPVTELAPGELTHRWPQILPGGKAVLFTVNSSNAGFDGANIEVMSLTDRRRKTLERGGTYGRYLATSKGAGYLTYINNGTLFAVPFDLDTLTVRGTPSPVLEEVAYSPQNGLAQFDFSRSGTLVYQSGGAAGRKLLTVQWLDGAGMTQPLLAKPGPYVFPRLSPDGERLALMVTGASNPDIWIYEWQRDTMTRLTFGGFNNSPTWSPDGRYIVFEARGGMFSTRSDGAGQPQPLTQSKIRQVPYSIAPDAKRLAFFDIGPRDSDIWTLPLESDGSGLRAGKPEPFLQTPFNERHPTFSPDGRWLAYDSNESGSYQVYVRAFPDKGGKWPISNGGALYPSWARNGRELFFRALDNRIMVAGYTVKGDSFLPDKPRLWSDKQIADPGVNGINYALAPDGKRIAALMPAEAAEAQQAQNHLIFLENFFDDLRRRVPAGK